MLVLIVGCSRHEPPTPSDASSAAPRLVVLSPALAIILRDAGCEDLIVGRHAFDMVLDPAIPICGDQGSIEYETLLRAQPTHVLTQLGAVHIPDRLRRYAREQGFTLIDTTMLTLDEIAAAADDLQQRFAPAPTGERLGDRLLASIMRRPAGSIYAGRVLLIHQTAPATALGPGSFHGQILERLGAIPALDGGGPYQELAAEDVLRLAPDAIVLIQPRSPRSAAGPEPAWEDLRARLGPLADLPIPAIDHRRIALIDDPLALTPSTAMIDLADRLAQILQRWSSRDGPP